MTKLKIDKNNAILAAREALWRKGNISWKLDTTQQDLYKVYRNSPERTVVWNCSRQLGKSTTLCIVAIQTCFENPNTVVKYLAPTQKMARTITRTIMRQLLDDCPTDIKPEFKVADGLFIFSNGSEIQIGGADSGRAENIRGSKAHLVIVDEAGFIGDLEYIVNSILIPTTTTTRGKIILASTPPKSAAHAFVTFLRRAEILGAYAHKTIFDNPRLSKEDIDSLASAAGGYESVNFRREYLAQIITDSSKAVVPEFTNDVIERTVKEWPRPPFFDAYDSMDIGFKDLTVVLFAYYDFRNDKVVIDDEFVINGQAMTTSVLADAIKSKERELLTDPFTGEQRAPYKRVSDNNLIVLQDLYRLHNLIFHPTRKDDKEAAVNNFRMLIAAEKVIINPRCKTLIRHIRDGTWMKSKNQFDHSDVDNSHFDALDAAIYLVRNIDFNRNPYPKGFGIHHGDARFDKGYKQSQTQNNDWVFQMMNIKKPPKKF